MEGKVSRFLIAAAVIGGSLWAGRAVANKGTGNVENDRGMSVTGQPREMVVPDIAFARETPTLRPRNAMTVVAGVKQTRAAQRTPTAQGR
ncbi:MAG: hypothetical protein WC686_01925 [Candidatus Shapirobacteria bacterium]